MAPIVPARRGQYVRLNMGEKMKIYQFMMENPKASLARVADIFSEIFEKYIENVRLANKARPRKY